MICPLIVLGTLSTPPVVRVQIQNPTRFMWRIETITIHIIDTSDPRYDAYANEQSVELPLLPRRFVVKVDPIAPIADELVRIPLTDPPEHIAGSMAVTCTRV